VLVLVVACAAVVGTSALNTDARKPKPCSPGKKPLFCVDGRIVCCAPHDACDCGGGQPVR
jgi:hypothetical protein